MTVKCPLRCQGRRESGKNSKAREETAADLFREVTKMMEINRAIHKLDFMRSAYQKLINEKVDEGRFVGTDITGTWKADTPLDDAYKEHIEAITLAISALEFKDRYDQFWEEVKAAGKSGKETEIRHGGRVFRIREVAQ